MAHVASRTGRNTWHIVSCAVRRQGRVLPLRVAVWRRQSTAPLARGLPQSLHPGARLPYPSLCPEPPSATHVHHPANRKSAKLLCLWWCGGWRCLFADVVGVLLPSPTQLVVHVVCMLRAGTLAVWLPGRLAGWLVAWLVGCLNPTRVPSKG